MQISDTLKNQKKELEFSDKVRIYLCGVTVYDQSHIGHARTIIVFDTLRRFLESNGTPVELIQNFTDVSDETAIGASKVGLDEHTFTQKYEKEFLEKMNLLSNQLKNY